MEKQLRDFDDKALIRTFKLFSAAAAQTHTKPSPLGKVPKADEVASAPSETQKRLAISPKTLYNTRRSGIWSFPFAA